MRLKLKTQQSNNSAPAPNRHHLIVFDNDYFCVIGCQLVVFGCVAQRLLFSGWCAYLSSGVGGDYVASSAYIRNQHTYTMTVFSFGVIFFVLSVWGQEICFFSFFNAVIGMLLRGMGERFLLSKDEPLTPDIDGVMAL